ncbi:MAG TPA: metalloregulator ArsR/SmtB family transcription factor [Luteimonas sp.]|nr:metalloregulator ArsR/SmtB family transcription factor [Luteimonas sp.]
MPRARPRTAKLADAAPIFAALGDPTRLRIVTRLGQGGPLPIVRLTEGTRLTRQAVTKHLNALSDAGLVKSERSGRERVWQLQPRRLAEVRRYLDMISAQWDGALERLRGLVEEDDRDG